MKSHVLNISNQLQAFENELSRLEARILELDQRLETLTVIERNHLLRLKNHEHLSDDFIMNGRSYQDLSPEKAWALYNDKNFDFIIIDISSSDFTDKNRIPEAIDMPWEVFQDRFIEIQTKTTPILIISEDGTNSILACEFMSKRGYFNCNNISGGHKFWVGNRLVSARERSA